MNSNILELSDNLRAARNTQQFWDLCVAALEKHGVTSLLYGAVAFRDEIDRRHITRSLFIKSNHPASYIEEFGDETLLDAELTSLKCMDTSDPIVWHDEREWASATPQQVAQARIERDLGLHVGLTYPASNFSPGQIGGIGLSMASTKANEFDGLWKTNGQSIIAICGLLDLGMRELHLGRMINLSPREKECLRLLAAGFRMQQIEDRLDISTSTVETHFVNARRKLKSTTATQAVAKAIFFKIIQV